MLFNQERWGKCCPLPDISFNCISRSKEIFKATSRVVEEGLLTILGNPSC
jgi:hypothetical protein